MYNMYISSFYFARNSYGKRIEILLNIKRNVCFEISTLPLHYACNNIAIAILSLSLHIYIYINVLFDISQLLLLPACFLCATVCWQSAVDFNLIHMHGFQFLCYKTIYFSNTSKRKYDRKSSASYIRDVRATSHDTEERMNEKNKIKINHTWYKYSVRYLICRTKYMNCYHFHAIKIAEQFRCVQCYYYCV